MKKKILIASFCVAIMLIVPFTAMAGDTLYMRAADEPKEDHKEESVLTLSSGIPRISRSIRISSIISEMIAGGTMGGAGNNGYCLALFLVASCFSAMAALYAAMCAAEIIDGFPIDQICIIAAAIALGAASLWQQYKDECRSSSNSLMDAMSTLISGATEVTGTTEVFGDCGCGEQAYPMGDATQQGTYTK